MTQAGALRPARSEDARVVAGHRYPNTADAEAAALYAAWVEGALERGVYLGWLHEQDTQVIARVGLVLLEWGPTCDAASPYRARVVNVYTAPAWRRQGIARHLVAHALNAARSKGITQFALSSTDEAHDLYVGLGFRASLREMRLGF